MRNKKRYPLTSYPHHRVLRKKMIWPIYSIPFSNLHIERVSRVVESELEFYMALDSVGP